MWGSQIVAPAADLYQADIPDPSAWTGRVTSVGFATHAAGNPAEVRRMTTGATLRDHLRGREERQERRALRPRRACPPPWDSGCPPTACGSNSRRSTSARPKSPPTSSSPAWRTFAFTAAIARGPGPGRRGQHLPARLADAGVPHHVRAGRPGRDAVTGARSRPPWPAAAWRTDLPAVLQVLYRDAAPGGAPERLVSGLTALSNETAVTECLDRHGSLLWAADTAARTADLAHRTYRDTVAAALLAAVAAGLPGRPGPRPHRRCRPADRHATEPAAIWLTETSGGGLGLIEQLVRFYTQDPRRFWGLVDSALGPGDYEYTDAALTHLLGHVVDVPAGQAAQAMARLRGAASARDADLALQDLRAAWAEFDGHPRQPAVAALSARLLRPGSTQSTDVTALGVLRAWDDLQDRLGFEIDARVIAFARRIRPARGAGHGRRGHGRSGLQHAVAARQPGPDAAPAALPAVRRPSACWTDSWSWPPTTNASMPSTSPSRTGSASTRTRSPGTASSSSPRPRTRPGR